ncbi:cupin domain-containing protein [Streptomyces hoynatensis]|uniref:Cupin domain-containing protein n=1 Tax=Streptomyces hoynatensis TaxID=1141874 RepID=A0A3A9Z7H8_9ACTN|nr:cupin domain-containing protein [Streptomyces hoynatensis]RKN43824.1 cupin domain-containing protein [Streptomyces hoynatensis]
MSDTNKPGAVVNLAHKLSLFSELWAQKKIAGLNDYEIKLAKLKGEFVWHTHEDTDELFLVLSGRLTIRLRDAGSAGSARSAENAENIENVVLEPGELFVVPRGAEHCPVAEEETAILLVEPRGVLNTGSAGGPMTRPAEPLD